MKMRERSWMVDRQKHGRLSQTLGNDSPLREGRVSKDGVEFATALEGGTYITGRKARRIQKPRTQLTRTARTQLRMSVGGNECGGR